MLMLAIMPTGATTQSPSSEFGDRGPLAEMFKMQRIVEEQNACALPGCVFKNENFMGSLHNAWNKGFIATHTYEYVADGMRNGFSVGAQRELLEAQGQCIFRNYKSAYEGRASVSDAVYDRVAKKRSIRLGTFAECYPLLKRCFKSYKIFPMSAVPKPHDPTTLRPCSDHRKSGFNDCTILGLLRHSLTVEKDVAWFLEQGFFMSVADVEDAFTIIPLAPWLWPYFFFRWFSTYTATSEDVFVHLFGDFGTA